MPFQQHPYHQPNFLGGPPDKCARCNAIGVPLLTCDDIDSASDNKEGLPELSRRLRFCPTCMIGKKVRVFWPVDNSWYVGNVQQFDASTGEHLLKYEDDDTEWVQIGESNTTLNPSVPLHPALVGSAIPQQAAGSVTETSGDGGPRLPQEITENSNGTEKSNNTGQETAGKSGGNMPATPSIANEVVTSPDVPPSSSYHMYGSSLPLPGSSYPSSGGQHHFPPHLANPQTHPHHHTGYSQPPGGPPPPPSSSSSSSMYPGLPGYSSSSLPHGPSVTYGYPGQHSMTIPPHHVSSTTGRPLPHYGNMHSNPRTEVQPSNCPSGSGGNSRGKKTGPKAWAKDEDKLLLSIVQSMRVPMKWSLVAQNLPERTGKQCRERYVNHLNPRLKVTDWSPTEDATIFHLYNTIGSHWAKMSKIIPGRTDNGIKNRFHNLRRQLEREDEHRLRLSAARDFPEEIRLELLREFPIELRGKVAELWDIKSGLSVLAAQSILGGGMTRTSFGPFREAKASVETCVRCGFILPSVQTGSNICTKTGWCESCARIPPHVSGNMLRECLNLRRCQQMEKRKIIESWKTLTSSSAVK